MAIRAKWKGSDPAEGHLNGIPASDLDEEQWQLLDADQRKAVRGSGLYEVRTDREAAPKKYE